MALTRSFNETIKTNLQTDMDFRKGLLQEAVSLMLAGDLEIGKGLLRKYINGTVGFVDLGAQLNRSPKTLMQMLSAKGNPGSKALFQIIAHLLKREGIAFGFTDQAA